MPMNEWLKRLQTKDVSSVRSVRSDSSAKDCAEAATKPKVDLSGLSDLTERGQVPQLDANGVPCGLCPTCSQGEFWRWPCRHPSHEARGWTCCNCAPPPRSSGLFDYCGVPTPEEVDGAELERGEIDRTLARERRHREECERARNEYWENHPLMKGN